MDVTPLLPEGRQLVESYGEGRFRVSGQLYEGSVLVSIGRSWPWPVTRLDELTLDSLAPLFALPEPADVLLLGCGPSMLPVPLELRQAVKSQGLVLEPMATGAAARTYNVLLGEGRRVAAALIAVA